VVKIGDQLQVAGEMVHVTEGCSGIRSAQSFLMVSLFFGEWLRLRPSARVGLVLAGFVIAWVFNTLRATGLSIIRVEGGEAAFDEWHDGLGYAASIVGAGVLYLLALGIDRMGARRRRVRRILVERRPA
jgi:exosortase/archaeosortase family protein